MIDLSTRHFLKSKNSFILVLCAFFWSYDAYFWSYDAYFWSYDAYFWSYDAYFWSYDQKGHCLISYALKLSIFASFHKSSPGPLVITPKESHEMKSIV